MDEEVKPRRKRRPRPKTAIIADAAARWALKFHGAPCKAGHDGLRYVATGACVYCQHGHARRQRANKAGGQS